MEVSSCAHDVSFSTQASMQLDSKIEGEKIKMLSVGGVTDTKNHVMNGFTGCVQVTHTHTECYYTGCECCFAGIVRVIYCVMILRVCVWVSRPPVLYFPACTRLML